MRPQLREIVVAMIPLLSAKDFVIHSYSDGFMLCAFLCRKSGYPKAWIVQMTKSETTVRALLSYSPESGCCDGTCDQTG